MRDLCISFASSFFLFPVGGGSKMLEDCGDGGRGYFCWGGEGGGSVPPYMPSWLVVTSNQLYFPSL